jgi:hypothetical protein
MYDSVQLIDQMSIPLPFATDRKSKVIRERNIRDSLPRHWEQHLLAQMTSTKKSAARGPASAMGH